MTPSQQTLRFLGIAVFIASGWVMFGSRLGAAMPRPAGLPRDISCTYRTQMGRLPRDARQIRVWIPLAKTGREQRILAREIHSPVAYTIAQDPDYGNDILHVALQPPIPEQLEIAVDYRARLFGGETAAVDASPTPEELQRSLRPSGLVIVDEEVRARARQAAAGRLTLAGQARGIYDAVRQAMVYDKTVPGWGRGDTRRACALGRGNCTDFHSLFISMACAQQIPARFKIGFVIPEAPSGIVPGYHCWAEFYAQGRGWVPVDASEAWKHPELADYYFGAHDSRRFLISTGRDIRLIPAQEGEPVNIFFAPYVEIDGQASSDVGVEVRFSDLQQGRTT
ncbi:MAG: transglutaminase domain-containing protein [Candidatus Omnitrophica bacterium]|nr:transglutaminase domain-containing protein [Candidatus Omnitrophota bacterium]